MARVEGSGRAKGTPNKPKVAAADGAAPAPRRDRRPSQRRAAAPLTTEMWPLARLHEYERNPRKNDAFVDRMAAHITAYGFRIPIVATSDGTIVDGHLRFKAARKLGLESVPVALADGLTEREIRAFRIAANKSARWASDDRDLLVLEFGELRADGKTDMELTGWGLDEIGKLFEEPAPPPVRSTVKTVACPKCGHSFSP